jgi:hypothetical protein
MDYPLPLLGLFNHMVSYVELPDGRSFFLDGTAAYHGYRELPGPDQGLNVLVLFDDRAEFKRTPVLSPDDNRLTAATVIRLGPNGVGAVHRTVSYGAKDAGAQRFRFHVPEKRRAVIEEYWNGLYPGTEVFHETFSNLANLSAPVRVEYDATVPRLYDPAAAKVQLDAIIQPSGLAGLYGKKAGRRWPLVIPENQKEVSELTYVLPAEYAVAALPLTKELRTRFGTFRLETVATPGQVTVRQDLELYAQRIAPDDYPAFREFCLNVDDWEGEPIQLEKTP